MLITLTLPLKGPENSTHGTEKFKQKKLVCPKIFESETLPGFQRPPAAEPFQIPIA
jgi:hypothetical protein